MFLLGYGQNTTIGWKQWVGKRNILKDCPEIGATSICWTIWAYNTKENSKLEGCLQKSQAERDGISHSSGWLLCGAWNIRHPTLLQPRSGDNRWGRIPVHKIRVLNFTTISTIFAATSHFPSWRTRWSHTFLRNQHQMSKEKKTVKLCYLKAQFFICTYYTLCHIFIVVTGWKSKVEETYSLALQKKGVEIMETPVDEFHKEWICCRFHKCYSRANATDASSINKYHK